jgi:hypothetical protein
MINQRKTTMTTATTTYKNAAAHRNAIMPSMGDRPMSEVVEFMAKNVMIKGKPMGASKAKAYYIDGVKRLGLPGKVELEVKKPKTKAPKAPKAPKASKAVVVKAAKAPADRKEVLKAAAKRAGIHRDTIAEAQGNDDPLGLAAPESLSFEDLNTIL